MRTNTLIIGLFSVFLLSACSENNSDNKAKINSQLLDSQLKTMEKARQVEADINAAMKKRDKKMEQMSR